ncbi:type I 3-dehydroquinate dehydratase [Aminipila luticellarii]|uniref:3-dehydroquinate dehydratase n=1 Tax=Aminipila luticellarii TaxID=2507160 RepID=A0A410PS94_9FIRM|nr:type I 3-dehydroquinate dehydratase [Aminipila luticellarii]QAT41790.1 type I 3-dehydroquinate dehydratase [Aminipila luticellarii]
MKTIQIRNLIIGEGRPKLCVPIVDKTEEEILANADMLRTLPIDLIEWRADFFQEVMDPERVTDTLFKLRKLLKNMPILFTFRTAKEGGERQLEPKSYAELNKTAEETGCIDLIDIEAFLCTAFTPSMISEAHRNQVKVIASNHDFTGTPPKSEMLSRLCQMQEQGADMVKLAVMPKTTRDLLTLLDTTLEMNEKHAKVPVVTMSMSELGSLSRICGEYFGSAITFGSVQKASAPGQIEAGELAQILNIVHRNLQKT